MQKIIIIGIILSTMTLITLLIITIMCELLLQTSVPDIVPLSAGILLLVGTTMSMIIE